MFTGLIEEIGEITEISPVGDSLRLTIRGEKVTADAGHGDSISVSGVCLTVIEQGEATFAADVMAQSIRVSTLGALSVGDRVNLERAARVDSRLGGHIVQGHVDGTAQLLSVTPEDNWRVLRFALPRELAPLLVDKGSVTLSGVSLTVSNIAPVEDPEPWFEVSLIPETLVATTLGGLQPGDRVNVETDILARHVARMLRFGLAAGDDPRGLDLTGSVNAPASAAPQTPTEGN
ncbi:riboflavin synthase subunit alpha [Leucobacter sp. OLJS4]|uniref:riboflavin synthase n=1 Tax=unclassified Leucobacter TaxID=2621730 RepID=UPI000C18C69A|nr:MULTISPECIES: riboflavin synthase [unclassified Leucobacter]PII86736.1 riboflavin synthase subunit alpha [Leucobacter sp. OLCALW19]PII88953.1 riboflavin synthase subunit alpha [Leucobacter sp. OLAS13]PII96804.1 riboflavin synthase subunit alpha [Leucobacter sp. OLCS4]PII99316.1 riboflavin synthase subunit alpha [Leucobacter sp. OLDS2]PIJ05020.1 riboflavin synthase subunit alpha [Leucobacter sp. OLIS6]